MPWAIMFDFETCNLMRYQKTDHGSVGRSLLDISIAKAKRVDENTLRCCFDTTMLEGTSVVANFGLVFNTKDQKLNSRSCFKKLHFRALITHPIENTMWKKRERLKHTFSLSLTQSLSSLSFLSRAHSILRWNGAESEPCFSWEDKRERER